MALQHENPPPSLLKGKRVVICEDEGITQMQLRRMLTQMGLVVVGAANNGQTGVEVVRQTKPDLVLMDINMPLMDGLEASRILLQETNVCIVMLTAYNDFESEARDLGACGYVVKPVIQQLLIPELVHALQAHEQKQDQG